MKSIIALCLLAVLCTVSAIPVDNLDLDSLRHQVRNLIYTIDNDILRLDRLRFHTEEDTNRKVNDKLNAEEDNYRDYKDELLKDLRNKVLDAKENGKEVTKVDNCYKSAVEGLDSEVKTAREAASKCTNNAEKSITSYLSFLDNLIETARMYISELDDIFLVCHDIDILKKENCIINELSEKNAEVRKLEDDIVTAEITVGPLSNNVIKQAANCFKNAFSPIYSTGDTLKLSVQQCINDA